jgi:hypothetical protein
MGRRSQGHPSVKWIVLTDTSGLHHRHELDEQGRLLHPPTRPPAVPITMRSARQMAIQADPARLQAQLCARLPIPPRIRQKLTAVGAEFSLEVWNDYVTNSGPWIMNTVPPHADRLVC